MRMDQDLEVSAKDILNNYSLEDLTRIFRDYGEEKMLIKSLEKLLIEDQLR